MFFGYCIKISTEITPLRNRGRNTGERLTLRGQVITAHKLRRGFIFYSCVNDGPTPKCSKQASVLSM